MTRVSTDITWVVAGTLVAAALALLDAPDAIRLLPGLAATLLLPGYALSVALFPDRDFDIPERLGLAFGLSLAVVVVLSILISWSSWGFRTTPIILGLTGATIALSVVAEWRRRSTTARPTTAMPSGASSTSLPLLASVPFPVLTLVVVFGLAASGIALAMFPPSGVTEFYAVSGSASSEQSPQQVVAGEQSTLGVGIKNGEGRPARFRVAVTLDGQSVGTTGPISLEDREEWRGNVDFAVTTPGPGQRLDVRLYKEGSLEPYRSLRFWVDALPSP
jgi:uncharacterized membrane protein